MVSITTRASVIENFVAVPLSVVVAGSFAIWAFVLDRTPPLSLSEGEITPHEVVGGGSITARWRITVQRSSTYSQVCTREIVDSLNTVYRVNEQTADGVSPPEESHIARSVRIPFGVAWGPAYYRQQCCYQFDGASLTALFPVCVRRPPLSFEILPNK